MTKFRDRENFFECKNPNQCSRCIFESEMGCIINLLIYSNEYLNELKNELTEEDIKEILKQGG